MDGCYQKETLDGGIVVFRMLSVSRECIDLWYQDVTALFAQAVTEESPVRFLYDVRVLTIPSSHALRRAEQLARLPLPEDWRVATLSGSTFATEIINLIRSVSLTSSTTFSRSRIFSDEAKSLAWLRQA